MRCKSLILILVIFNISEVNAQAVRNFEKSDRPVYEIGGGAVGTLLPNYPGAKNSTYRYLPFPYFIYRGKTLRADDEGTRAKIKASEDYEFGISFSLDFPVESSENDAREGMPDLNTILGVGPQIMFRVLKDNSQKLNMTAAVRGAFAFGDNLESYERGLMFEQSIEYWRYLDKKKKTILLLGLEAEAGTLKYNDYYYTVDQRFKSVNREAYKAEAGLVQTNIYYGLIHNVTSKLSLFGGGFYSDFSNSQNRNSPLLEQDYNAGFFAGFFWLFMESDEKVNIYK
jgi:outer membrane protein